MYKIQLKYEGTEIKIEMNHRISVLSDNSGIGKTYVAQAIHSALKVKKYATITSVNNNTPCSIHVILGDETPDYIMNTTSKKDSIIIIDNADKVIAMNENIVNMIIQNKDSAYLLILRGDPEGLIIGPNQYLQFREKNKMIRIEPFKSNVNNFFKRDA